MRWFIALEPRLKCLWDYLCDNCDHAGFWDECYELASGRIGALVTKEDLACFGKRVVRVGDDKIWVRRFVEFQYTVGTGAREAKLNPKNNAHKGVIRLLESNGIDSTPWIEFVHPKLDVIHKRAFEVAPTQPLLSPTEEEVDVKVKTEEGGSGGETLDTLKAALAVAPVPERGLLRKWFRLAPRPSPEVPHV
jgi:hypothetical protein